MACKEIISICNRLLNEKPQSATQLNVIYDEIKLVCESYLDIVDELEMYKQKCSYLENVNERVANELADMIVEKVSKELDNGK